MMSCLPLTVTIQHQPDGLLSNDRFMPSRFRYGHIFSTADLASVNLATGDGFAIFDLLFCSLTVWTLTHMPFISCLLY
jgi:hypothetical protein